jgi:predicted extracellular nuclease
MLRPSRGATLAVALALPLTATPLLAGTAHAVPALESPVFINEIHYDNAGTDTGEFIEVANPTGRDLTGWSLVLYNGGTSTAATTYSTRTLAGADRIQVAQYPTDGIQNGAADGVALVDGTGALVQLLSYEGVLTAANGPAAGRTSTDIGVREAGTEQAGQSLQLTGTGATPGQLTWTGPAAASPGTANAGQVLPGGGGGTPPVDPPVDPPAVTTRRISEVQGTAAATPLAGQTVTIEAVVTSLFERADVVDGFFVQEEDADADTDAASSEGLFVFCGSTCPVSLATGDRVKVSGTAAERFGMTQISATSGTVQVQASGQSLPAAVEVALPAAGSTRDAATFEAVEGMIVRIPGTLAVSEYFNLGRYGTLSRASRGTQPSRSTSRSG